MYDDVNIKLSAKKLHEENLQEGKLKFGTLGPEHKLKAKRLFDDD